MTPRQNPHLTIIPPFRNPSLPNAPSPRHCPECPNHRPFNTEAQRDLHYFQHHVLRVRKIDHPRRLRVLDTDEGNYSGPLGEGKHFVEPERYWEGEVEEMGIKERMELEKVRKSLGVSVVGVAQQLMPNLQVVREDENGGRVDSEVGILKMKAGNVAGVDSSAESISVGCLTSVCPKIWGKVSENIVMLPAKGHFRWR